MKNSFRKQQIVVFVDNRAENVEKRVKIFMPFFRWWSLRWFGLRQLNHRVVKKLRRKLPLLFLFYPITHRDRSTFLQRHFQRNFHRFALLIPSLYCFIVVESAFMKKERKTFCGRFNVWQIVWAEKGEKHFDNRFQLLMLKCKFLSLYIVNLLQKFIKKFQKF